MKKTKTPKVPNHINRTNVNIFVENYIEHLRYVEALDLVSRFKLSGYTVTKTTVKKTYKLKDADIAQLVSIEVKNPHYSTSAPMVLYLKYQVENYNIDILRKKKLAILLNNLKTNETN
jgi:hypothetical protein